MYKAWHCLTAPYRKPSIPNTLPDFTDTIFLYMCVSMEGDCSYDVHIQSFNLCLKNQTISNIEEINAI